MLPNANFVGDDRTFKIKFGYGTHSELIKYIATIGRDRITPLIWLVNGRDNHDDDTQIIEREGAKFIIAVPDQDSSILFSTLLTTDYATTIDVIAKNLQTALKTSGKTDFSDEFTYERAPNFSYNEKNTKESFSGQKWNAAILTGDLTVKPFKGCFNKISFT
jgi:hypothetical protein